MEEARKVLAGVAGGVTLALLVIAGVTYVGPGVAPPSRMTPAEEQVEKAITPAPSEPGYTGEVLTGMADVQRDPLSLQSLSQGPPASLLTALAPLLTALAVGLAAYFVLRRRLRL